MFFVDKIWSCEPHCGRINVQGLNVWSQVGVTVGNCSGCVFLLLLAFFPGHLAFGWGLNNDLNNPAWSKASLVFPALRNHSVQYCIEILSPRFRMETVVPQIESALRVWLSEMNKAGFPQVSVAQVSCDSTTKNLKIVFGPETAFPEIGAYQSATVEGDYAYSMVKIDSEFRYKVADQNGPISDFFDLVGVPGEAFPGFLESVSFVSPKGVRELASEKGLNFYALYWSTYRIFVHEFGHSFGLCDTYAADQQCDPAYRSAEQPTSVMKDSLYFHLTDDDRAGVAALFARLGSGR